MWRASREGAGNVFRVFYLRNLSWDFKMGAGVEPDREATWLSPTKNFTEGGRTHIISRNLTIGWIVLRLPTRELLIKLMMAMKNRIVAGLMNSGVSQDQSHRHAGNSKGAAASLSGQICVAIQLRRSILRRSNTGRTDARNKIGYKSSV